jgi:hypothetical protein
MHAFMLDRSCGLPADVSGRSRFVAMQELKALIGPARYASYHLLDRTTKRGKACRIPVGAVAV